ncbi:EEF1A lysine methyltransferase 3 [Excalfactoria chinensis]|uniref:EEF1A lysine methyltransferase 3 n=1 Tax=Excalfactoria chinensis TaxID=46218 RepID=UPI003B3A3F34
MAAPTEARRGETGTGAEEDEAAEDDGSEDEDEAGPCPLVAVFPRDPELFSDTFRELRRFRFCGRVLRIAQHHGPRLGMAAAVWDGALALCRFFEEQHMNFRGRSVIELGAGTGIVGILAATLGGDVTLTDLPLALEQLRDNAERNAAAVAAAGGRVVVEALPWGRELGCVPRGYDVVLGADVVYEPRCFPALLDTLLQLCGPPAIAFLSCGMRPQLGTETFFQQLLPMHFCVQLLRHHQDTNVGLYRLTRRSDGCSHTQAPTAALTDCTACRQRQDALLADGTP